MCTLIVGVSVLGPASFVVAANRDEDPSRPSLPPQTLATSPLVVGGRDRIAGGTWLAVRDGRALVAVLNRRLLDATRARPGADAPMRSRGLLALDVVVADPEVPPSEFPAAALAEAGRSTRTNRYAPFALACVSVYSSWVMTYEGTGTVRVDALAPGWHVLTHADLDDAREPRTVRLSKALRDFTPADPAAAESRMLELLSLHEQPGAGEPPTGAADAAVCIHGGRMVTVSSSIVTRAGDVVRYVHVEGRPCTTEAQDLTALLAGGHVARKP